MSTSAQLPPTSHTPTPYDGPSRDQVIALRHQYVSPGVITYYKDPLMIVEGNMQYLWDETGKRYLDGFAGIVTVSVGHCHPKVIDKVREQTGKLQHTTTIYLHPSIAQFAEKLASKMPEGLTRSYFTNSGSEANEVAILSAREYTGNDAVVALRNGYHGGTSGADGAHRAWHLEIQIQRTAQHTAHQRGLLLPLPVRSGISFLRSQVRVRREECHSVSILGRDRLLHRRTDPRRRRHGHSSPGILQDRLRHRPSARRPLHRRRSAGGLRPYGAPLLVASELRRRARWHLHGQGHRQRHSTRRASPRPSQSPR